MRIIWHGHACFEIQSKEGIIVVDPYKDNSVPGLYMSTIKADLVLTSHGHSDHNAKDKVELLNRDKDIKMTQIHSFHDDKQGSLRGNNIIHVIELEDMKVVHLGDLGCDIDEEILNDCDVLMIPIGGHYTIDAKMAKNLVDKIKPRIVIPMHYRGDTFGYEEISTLDEFKTLASDIIEYNSNIIEVDKNTKKQTVMLKIS
ncbi:MAG: MBL fold metallo-hydrolase [Bacilli bacterium]|nr:MBL fold metallo-hydrolase [Bacilli bacterium]